MRPGLTNIVIGLSTAVLGQIFTFASYNLGFGGRYVAFGAILIGTTQFGFGIFQYVRHAKQLSEQKLQYSKQVQAAYNGLIRSLIAVASADGEVNDGERKCIEMIHKKLYSHAFTTDDVLELAARFNRENFDVIRDLSDCWSLISADEREEIIKLSSLVAFADGPINQIEKDMIARLATTLRIRIGSLSELLAEVKAVQPHASA